MVTQWIIPKDFVSKYSKILGDEVREFIKYCKIPTRPAVRINTLKKRVEEVLREIDFMSPEKIPFCDYAFRINYDKPGNTLSHFLGHYYVQDPASLVPVILLAPKPGEKVLDMTAAPGGKTTHIAQLMENRGTVVANDVRLERVKMLRSNLERMGVLNTIVTMNDAMSLGYKKSFDKVLLDAPCSSEGEVRKRWNALSGWSQRRVEQFSRVQKRMIKRAVAAAKPGGTIVYSTCTLSPEENEEVIQYALENLPVKIVRQRIKGLKHRPGLEGYDCRDCLRIWPQDNDTIGFFACKMVKTA